MKMQKTSFLTIIYFICFLTVFSNINVSLIDTPLENALKILEEASGSIILTSPDIKGTKNVTINTVNLENALDILLYSTNYEYKKISEDFYLVGNFNIKIQNMQKELSQIEFQNLDLKKISNLLILLSEKIFVIQNSNLILLNKNDQMYISLKELFEFLEAYAGKNNSVIIFSINEISENVYQFLKNNENEKEENKNVFLIKNKSSIIFLENNFEFLTRIKEVNYFEITEPFSLEKELYTFSNSDNITLGVCENELTVKYGTMKDNDSMNLNSGENGYLVIENEDKHYIIVLSYLNLNNLDIKRNDEIKPASKTSFNTEIGYQFSTNNLVYSSGIKFGKNYIKISSDLKNLFDFSISANLVKNVSLGVQFMKNLKESNVEEPNVTVFISDLQEFEQFSLYGKLGLGGTIKFHNSITNSIDFMYYDLLILNEIFGNNKDIHKIIFAPGAGLKVSKNDKLNPYFNFGAQYSHKLQKLNITVTYLYQMKSHKVICTFEL